LSLEDIQAIVFSVVILFVAFISYEGLSCYSRSRNRRVPQGVFGFMGGLLNGYLVIGTVWMWLPTPTIFRQRYRWSPPKALPSFTHHHQLSAATNGNELILLAIGMVLLVLVVIK